MAAVLCHVGIDYSMTSPAICVHRGSEWSIANCTFHFFSPTKNSKPPTVDWLIQYDRHEAASCSELRFDRLSRWAIDVIKPTAPDLVCVEGYAMGASGQVFHIGENAGLLKHKLWKEGLAFITPAPTALKKFATGKGSAKKEDMEAAFRQETSIDFRALLNQSAKSWNPSSDIIDAYYLAKFCWIQSLS